MCHIFIHNNSVRVEKLSLRNFSGELRMSQLVNDRIRTQSYSGNMYPPRTNVTSLTLSNHFLSPQIQGDSVEYSWGAAKKKKILCCSKLSLSILLPVCRSYSWLSGNQRKQYSLVKRIPTHRHFSFEQMKNNAYL